MNETEKIEKTLNSFLRNEATNVLFIRGEWGIGKTYFWESYIREKLDQKKVESLAYSYASLFGVSNISQLREKIQSSAKVIDDGGSSIKKIEEFANGQNQVFELLYGNKARQLESKFAIIPRILSGARWGTLQLGFISEFYRQYRESLIFEYLICIDDFERKQDDLEVSQVMGLINELSIQRRCKFVVILNEEKLENENASDFKKYREKVADIEVVYSPSTLENILKVFSGKELYFEKILEIFKYLGSVNIRIFKRFKWAIEHIQEYTNNCEDAVKVEIAAHLALYSWAFLESDQDLSLLFVKQSLNLYGYMIANMHKDKDDSRFTEYEKRWLNEVVSNLPISEAKYDDNIINLIQYGYLLDEGEFIKNISEENEKEKKYQYRQRIENVFNMYQYSLRDNQKEIVQASHNLLAIGLEIMGFSDFSKIMELLDVLEEVTESYIEEYCQINSDVIRSIASEAYFTRSNIKNKLLAEKVENVRVAMREDIDLDSVLTHITEKQSHRMEQIDFLCSLSPSDIYDWINRINAQSLDKDSSIAAKLQEFLFYFRGTKGQDNDVNVKYRLILENFESALKFLAKDCNINRVRVQILYGIDLRNQID
ncbi:P-loop NTPase fold protein [Halomicronema sp. CCY15110]|uniref:P-loop NTPase fold protein n=1 Tax=Halomicronema sp. CCY15110 TaxID=2767773 RepID=UPI001951221D|nr:P-loop NTPase fold protein [Halomicronema sp. CCY15110]